MNVLDFPITDQAALPVFELDAGGELAQCLDMDIFDSRVALSWDRYDHDPLTSLW